VARLDDLADTVLRQALAMADQPSGAASGSADLASLLPGPGFASRLELALAAGVARVLGQHDSRIVAVFGYQPALASRQPSELTDAVAILGQHDSRIVAVFGYQPALASRQPSELTDAVAIRLLIVVTAPSAALQSFVGSLERALAASWRALPAVRPWRRELVLDANIMAQPAFDGGFGLAGLLLAPAAPIRLWSGAASPND
jgi:hypothetical protein